MQNRTTIQITNRANIPTDATAAIVTITATQPTDDGYLTVHPCDQPTASTLNYRTGDDIANTTITKLDPTGTLGIYTSATTHLLTDIAGYVAQ